MFTFDKTDRRARNMSEMMDRLGLDTDALACRRLGLDLSSAIRTCQFCNADEVCRDWLARAPKSLAKAPAFCPNATLLRKRALGRQQPLKLARVVGSRGFRSRDASCCVLTPSRLPRCSRC